MPWGFRTGDGFILVAYASVGDVVSAQITMRYVSGRIDAGQIQVIPTTDRQPTYSTPNSRLLAAEDGEVISFNCETPTTTTKRGQIYVRAYVAPASGVARTWLAFGYVTSTHSLTLGEYVESGPGGGDGFTTVTSTANPAAGAEVAATAVPTNAIWRIRSFQVQLVQGLTQTPLPRVLIRNGSAVTLALIPGSNAAQAVSSTQDYTWAIGANTVSVAAGAVAGSSATGLPDILLPETYDISTSTIGIGANSDYGVAVITAEEWIMV